MTIGQRAWQEICRTAEEEGISRTQETRNLDIDRSAALGWDRGNRNPKAESLRKMCLMGYDVIYILTGERTK